MRPAARRSGSTSAAPTAIVLTVAEVLIFVGGSRHGCATTLLAPGAIAAALLLLLGPWAWRIGRERDAERAERIRTQERADFAARAHHSALDTRSLIHPHPDDRAGSRPSGGRSASCALALPRPRVCRAAPADAVETAAAEIEELHACIDVSHGRRPLDDRTHVLSTAAREAMTNAAKIRAEEVSVPSTPHWAWLTWIGRRLDLEGSPTIGDSESIQGRMERG